MTWLFERLSLRRLAAAAMAEPIAVPSSTSPIFDPLEIFQQPIVIQRHRAHDIGPAGKRDDADAIVRPAFDEFARHLADGVDPGRRSPPIVKSLVSIEPETSSTSMMSIPLASTWVRVLPSCGRAIAMTKMARLTRHQRPQKFSRSRRAVLPSARKIAVDEKVNAAAGPLLARETRQAAGCEQKQRNQGWAKVSADCSGNQSGRFKLGSFDELGGFFQQQPAVVAWSRRSART